MSVYRTIGPTLGFFFVAKNINRGGTRSNGSIGSNEYSRAVCKQQQENKVYPYLAQFYIFEWGVRECKLHGRVSMM